MRVEVATTGEITGPAMGATVVDPAMGGVDRVVGVRTVKSIRIEEVESGKYWPNGLGNYGPCGRQAKFFGAGE